MHLIDLRRTKGGKGFNQAVALAKAGVEVYFAGAIGEDGLFLTKYLEDVGVNTEFLKVLNIPTGHAIIQVNSEGQNSIILYGGANRAVTFEMIDEVMSHFKEGDYVLLQNEISNVPYIIEQAKRRKMKVILNPSPVSKEMLSWPLNLVDMFLINEIEGEDITGQKDPQLIIDTLLDNYSESEFVLTLGENGVVYADQQHRIFQSAYTVKAIDTTAAGDTFTGYFIAALIKGKTISESLAYASKASAITVTRKGAGHSIPYMYELE